MKIAILSSGFFPVIDGVTITVFHRLQRLSQLGHQVLLFCPDYGMLSSLYPNWQNYVGNILPGVRVIPLASEPFMGLEFDRNVKRSAYAVVLKELQQFQPDLIHVDEPERLQLGFDRIPAVDFAKQYQTPCVCFLHTNFIEYLEDYFALPKLMILIMQSVSKRIVARIYNAYDATFVSSCVTSEKARKMGIKNLIDAELLGVNLAAFQPDLRSVDFFEQHYGLPDLAPKVKLIFLSRLTPDKGWKFLMQALTQMCQSPQYRPLFDQVVLIIAGEGSMRSEIAEKLAALPLTVHFLGRVDPAAVPALLSNSDLHVTTSEKETRGLTLLEAAAAGIPVLAPQAGGVVDTLLPGQTGLLFRPQDWQDFASMLRRLVNDPELRHRMGTTARQTATTQDWTPAIDRLIALWQVQIDRPRVS